jgi:mannose-6-phosphate isomerase
MQKAKRKPEKPILDPRSSILDPLRFVPFLRPMVWGGRRLGEVLGKELATAEPYGESWELSDHLLHRSRVAQGPLAGRTLRELVESEPQGILGDAAAPGATFPWLVKFLDAQDWLSVQVHPGEEAVRRLWPGEGSKTEAWFVLDARPGSRIYAGLKPGVDANRLRQCLAAGDVAACLHSFEPRAGDSVFLPAGTVHAVGGGVLLAEVQQTSDATFRLFDWNRKDAAGKGRTLHIEEALACIDWQAGPVQPVSAAGFPSSGTPLAALRDHKQRLVRCPYFELDYFRVTAPFLFGGGGLLQVVVVLGGQGCLAGAEGEIPLAPGQVWLLPAGMGNYLYEAATYLEMLVCTAV